MRRREFITLVGGAAATWPVAARGQQADHVRRVGMLMALTRDDADGQARNEAFRLALQLSGWTEGRNVRIDYRWSGGDADRIRKDAAELVALAPDVILTNGAAGVAPLLEATHTVPIVFVLVADPVGAGFVSSLAHPNGNATGFLAVEYNIGGKYLELLKEITPGVTQVAVVRDPAVSAGIGLFDAIQSAAASLGVEVIPVDVRDPSGLEHAIAALARRPNGGLLVTARRKHLLNVTSLSDSRHSTSFRASISQHPLSQPGDWFPTTPTPSISIVAPRTMLIASSRARSRAICPCRHRRSTSWSLISRRQRRLVSISHQCCSPRLTE